MIRLLITSGRGPLECRIAVRGVMSALIAEATSQGVEADVVTGPNPDGHGPSSAVVVLHGPTSDAFVKGWTGTVLWVARSPVRAHHKRKNWFVGISRLPDVATGTTKLEARDLRFDTFCAGGPGGQHQNKTESAVRATHLPTGLSVTSREARSQHRNKALALARLADLLAASKDLDILSRQRQAQAAHDALERGQPVRRFKGLNFEPE